MQRLEAAGTLLKEQPEAILPVTGQGTRGGRIATRRPMRLLACTSWPRWQQQTAGVWKSVDFLLTPTAGTIYTISAVEAIDSAQ